MNDHQNSVISRLFKDGNTPMLESRRRAYGTKINLEEDAKQISGLDITQIFMDEMEKRPSEERVRVEAKILQNAIDDLPKYIENDEGEFVLMSEVPFISPTLHERDAKFHKFMEELQGETFKYSLTPESIKPPLHDHYVEAVQGELRKYLKGDKS
jgi:hypothetical protein